ncbi:MAG TPA: 2-C-methyl-D-erythritol 4-phosphate cytidylyltransferase [Actinomycetota bacterium]|nr:2-C-methyl-D-erythritol 4-phosphate cytidylyltransferase [Actinomycetota bacterium]
MSTTGLLLAAGIGSRLGEGTPKAFVSINGRPMFVFSLEAMEASGVIDAVVLVAPRSEFARVRVMVEALGSSLVQDLVLGGASRSSSVKAGLAASPPNTDVVVCHDAARPFASPELFRRVIDALPNADGVVPVIPSPDTIKRLDGSRVVETIPRDTVGLAQTPQAFRFDALRAVHAGDPKDATDDAALVEGAGFHVETVEGEPSNFKITTREDLRRAEILLRSRSADAFRHAEEREQAARRSP